MVVMLFLCADKKQNGFIGQGDGSALILRSSALWVITEHLPGEALELGANATVNGFANVLGTVQVECYLC